MSAGKLRAPAAALIVVDDDVTVAEHQREVVVDGAEVEAGPAVNGDERVDAGTGMARRSIEEASAVGDGDVPALLGGERGGKTEECETTLELHGFSSGARGSNLVEYWRLRRAASIVLRSSHSDPNRSYSTCASLRSAFVAQRSWVSRRHSLCFTAPIAAAQQTRPAPAAEAAEDPRPAPAAERAKAKGRFKDSSFAARR